MIVGQGDGLLGWTGLSRLRVSRLRCLGVFGGQVGQFDTLLIALVDCVSQLVQVAVTQSALKVVHLAETNTSVNKDAHGSFFVNYGGPDRVEVYRNFFVSWKLYGLIMI